MGNERYSGGGYYGRDEIQDYGHDYGAGREGSYSSARDYEAAGGGRRDRYRGDMDRYGAGRGGMADRPRGSGFAPHGDDFYRQGRGAIDAGRGRLDDSDRGTGRYGRQPQGYDYQERGFFDRAGDEVRSWFGEEEAERRREADMRYDEQDHGGRHDSDTHYRDWRRGQVAALDRDYDEYRQENRARFDSEFSTWRTERQGQRDSLRRVEEHMDVVGSDGTHVGTVDKVRGDRVVLTKSDPEAGGHHHSIPSRWIQSVDDKVTLAKTAQAAKDHWRDEERNAMFGRDDRDQGNQVRDSQGRMLGRSFSGTY